MPGRGERECGPPQPVSVLVGGGLGEEPRQRAEIGGPIHPPAAPFIEHGDRVHQIRDRAHRARAQQFGLRGVLRALGDEPVGQPAPTVLPSGERRGGRRRDLRRRFVVPAQSGPLRRLLVVGNRVRCLAPRRENEQSRRAGRVQPAEQVRDLRTAVRQVGDEPLDIADQPVFVGDEGLFIPVLEVDGPPQRGHERLRVVRE